MWNAKVGTDTISKFLSGQESGWLDDSPFAVRPIPVVVLLDCACVSNYAPFD